MKDAHAVAGVLWTEGSPLHKDRVPTASDPIVLQLERMGAVVVGKTNTPEFHAGSHSFNSLVETTVSPYDLRYVRACARVRVCVRARVRVCACARVCLFLFCFLEGGIKWGFACWRDLVCSSILCLVPSLPLSLLLLLSSLLFTLFSLSFSPSSHPHCLLPPPTKDCGRGIVRRVCSSFSWNASMVGNWVRPWRFSANSCCILRRRRLSWDAR